MRAKRFQTGNGSYIISLGIRLTQPKWSWSWNWGWAWHQTQLSVFLENENFEHSSTLWKDQSFMQRHQGSWITTWTLYFNSNQHILMIFLMYLYILFYLLIKASSCQVILISWFQSTACHSFSHLKYDLSEKRNHDITQKSVKEYA